MKHVVNFAYMMYAVRILGLLIGAGCLVMAYRLFSRRVGRAGGAGNVSGRISGGGGQGEFKLTGAAPGTVFLVSGLATIAALLFAGSLGWKRTET